MSETTIQNNADESITQSAEEIKTGMEYISVDKLHPHDKNPRRDVGDVTELADSIKENGILQNLTVVPATGYWHGDYIVIIGHRRLAAAKQAGLTEVPCIVRNMTEKEQISTMLLENMQRHDLTPYEEAQGMQMMLDLGETIESVSEKTGFSRETIRKRTRLLTLNPDEFKKSEGRQVTLGDYDKLFDIKDAELRDKVLKSIGTQNFNFELESAKRQDKRKQNISEMLIAIDELGATEIDIDGTREHKYVNYAQNVKALNETVNSIPDGCAIYYYRSNPTTDWWSIYRDFTEEELQEKEEDDLRREEEEREDQELGMKREQLDEISDNIDMLRRDFILNASLSGLRHLSVVIQMLTWAITANDGWISADNETIAELLAIELPDDYEDTDPEEFGYKPFREMASNKPLNTALALAYELADCSNTCHNRYARYFKNNMLEEMYGFLTQLGYEMSDAEEQYINGTHEFYISDDEDKENAE